MGEDLGDDSEQDKDYEFELDDESDEGSDDDSDDGPDMDLNKDSEEVSRRELRQELENIETHAEARNQTLNFSGAAPQLIEVQNQPGASTERQAPREPRPTAQLPATQPDRIVQMPQSVCPGSIGNKEISQGHPWVPPSPMQHGPLTPSSNVPSTPQPLRLGGESPAHPPARPESQQKLAMAANSALAEIHHQSLSAPQKSAGVPRPHPQVLQGAGQLPQGMPFYMSTSTIAPPPPRPHPWPFQAEMAPMGPPLYHGTAKPGSNEMVNASSADRFAGPGMSSPWVRPGEAEMRTAARGVPLEGHHVRLETGNIAKPC